jgi:FdrA protein
VHEQIEKILSGHIIVINVGVRGFAESLEAQDIEVVQIDWNPPAGGDQEMIDLLENLL